MVQGNDSNFSESISRNCKIIDTDGVKIGYFLEFMYEVETVAHGPCFHNHAKQALPYPYRMGLPEQGFMPARAAVYLQPVNPFLQPP